MTWDKMKRILAKLEDGFWVEIRTDKHFLCWDEENFNKHMDWFIEGRAADERREAWQTRAACVLRDVEWIGDDDSDDNPCPYCDMTRRNGHSAECTLAALLKEADNG